ncbi:unnamed protein product [Prunus armeniaca]|uniref:Uncharacterized protein n=1 Tax=Prunus armeniaca TaxID=36596 RepID=A0A6J5VQ30_PRUAR|nr:unnamed protein product [Prunus armeniaca]
MPGQIPSEWCGVSALELGAWPFGARPSARLGLGSWAIRGWGPFKVAKTILGLSCVLGLGLASLALLMSLPIWVCMVPCRSARTLEYVLMVIVVTLELGSMKFRGAGLGRLGAVIKIFGFCFAVLVEAGVQKGLANIGAGPVLARGHKLLASSVAGLAVELGLLDCGSVGGWALGNLCARAAEDSVQIGVGLGAWSWPVPFSVPNLFHELAIRCDQFGKHFCGPVQLVVPWVEMMAWSCDFVEPRAHGLGFFRFGSGEVAGPWMPKAQELHVARKWA